MSQGRKVTLAVVLLVLSAGIFWYTNRPDDDPAFTRIAYPCLPLDTVTTEPEKFIMVSGNREPPLQHTLPDGSVVYPVYYCTNPKVVPLIDGKRLYFPVRFFDEDGVETPPLPPHNKPLSRPDCSYITRYMPDEVMQQLKTALQGKAP